MIEFKENVQTGEVIPAGRYLTTAEFAEKFGLTRENVRQLVSRNRIKSYVFFGRRLISENEYYKPKRAVL